jgi:hypothetical protein
METALCAQGEVTGADERFLVVGEELDEPKALLAQQRLDGLWHESFKRNTQPLMGLGLSQSFSPPNFKSNLSEECLPTSKG